MLKKSLIISLKYMHYHKAKSLLLVIAFTILLWVVLAVNFITKSFKEKSFHRAKNTKYLVSMRGDKYDITLKSLLFLQSNEIEKKMNFSDFEKISKKNDGLFIPLYFKHKIRGKMLVGTSNDYLDYRGFELKKGRFPIILGEIILSEKLAKDLGLEIGSFVLSENSNAFNLASEYPLKLNIVGIIKNTNSSDDNVIFCDLKTMWLIDGHGHGHIDIEKNDSGIYVRKKEKSNFVASYRVKEYQEVTFENINKFHFHGNNDLYKISTAIFLPKNKKNEVITKTKLKNNDRLQIIDSFDVFTELFKQVFKIQKLINIIFLLLIISSIILFFVVINLSYKMRTKEFNTFTKIGFPSSFIRSVKIFEILILISTSIVLALIMLIITSSLI